VTGTQWVPELADDCACRWTSPSGQPGWILEKRHDGCRSAVHGKGP